MKAVSLRVLFVLKVLCLATLAGGQPKAPLKCSTECSRFTSRIAAKRIRSYRMTESRCTKQAVIFITLKSLEICADPEEEWVKKIIQKLDQKNAAASPLPRDATSAVAPEEAGVFQKHVGHTVTVPSRATAPTSFFQGTGTTVLERICVPAARMEASSKPPPAMQDTTQVPAGSSPVIQEVAACSEVTPEANRDSLKSPAPSTTFAAGMVSSQSTPYPTALVHGFDNAVGSTEEPVGHTANATADIGDTTSPSSNSDPMAITKGSDHPVLSTNESLDPTSARDNAPDAASSSSSSDLPSLLDSMEITTVPATPVPPEATSVSTLNSTTAIDKGTSVYTNKVASSSAGAFGTRIFDSSSPVAKQEPSDTTVFTSQAFSGQVRVQITTERPNNLPLPSFLSRSQMHFIIPVSVVGGLMVCSVAIVWLYLKFGVKTEEMSREMVQGLLYQNEGHENSVYPMEVI
ncbi:fractalkine [Aquila chrysaetos chrysaetos]|uniref:C-X3-C motif chemokine ligand 1 n=1 Tax=Aquila chrysaetos chrysaetos TaxID=223781 RepID=A0A663EHC7_AQUCH|nr:fractalkine [Aquila chrysaetos chrysaetos]